MNSEEFKHFFDGVNFWLQEKSIEIHGESTLVSLEHILSKSDPRLKKDWDQWVKKGEALESISSVPVLAICGNKNAGKSTLTASLLSEEKKPFVLRGLSSDNATHRFVFWCPSEWRDDPSKQSCLSSLLDSAFGIGGSVEVLADDLDQAHAQYNARGHMSELLKHPIVGYDDALNATGIALLDCPDIDSSHDILSRERTAHIRRDAIKNAVRMCSGFLVLSTQSDWQVAGLIDLMGFLDEILGERPLGLCITHTDQSPDELKDDVFKHLIKHKISTENLLWGYSPRTNRENKGNLGSIEYFQEPESPWDFSSMFPPTDHRQSVSLHAAALQTAANALKQKTISRLKELRDEYEEYEGMIVKAVSIFLAKELCDTNGHFRLVITTALIHPLLQELRHLYRFKKGSGLPESALDNPDKIINWMNTALPRKTSKLETRVHRFSKDRLGTLVQETVSGESEGTHDGEINAFWNRMKQIIHSHPDLNGCEYAEELSEEVSGTLNEDLLRKYLRFRRPHKNIYRLIAFMRKVCLCPESSGHPGVMSIQEIIKDLYGWDLDEESFPTLSSLQSIAEGQVTSIYNWLLDLFGVRRVSNRDVFEREDCPYLSEVDYELLPKMNAIRSARLPIPLMADENTIDEQWARCLQENKK